MNGGTEGEEGYGQFSGDPRTPARGIVYGARTGDGGRQTVTFDTKGNILVPLRVHSPRHHRPYSRPTLFHSLRDLWMQALGLPEVCVRAVQGGVRTLWGRLRPTPAIRRSYPYWPGFDDDGYRVDVSPVIVCPDHGKFVAHRGRCPKCWNSYSRDNWMTAGEVGVRMRRARTMQKSEDG